MTQQDKLTQNFTRLAVSKKYMLAVQLGTIDGFYQFYFETLPLFTSSKECFENANDIHQQIFNQEKYSDVISFYNSLKYHLNKKK